MRTINNLTVSKIAKYRQQAINHPSRNQMTKADGLGLMMLFRKNGGCYWRFRFRLFGVANWVSCGAYPVVSIAEARELRDEYREMVRKGINPALARQESKVAPDTVTFADYAADWINRFMGHNTPKTQNQARGRLAKWVNPKIGKQPLNSITPPVMVRTLRKIEDSGARETAHRVRALLDRIFQSAITETLVAINPVPPANQLAKVVTNGFAAIVDKARFRKLYRDILNYRGQRVVKLAMQFLALTAVRPGELRMARWEEFDFRNMHWTIPAERMKMKRAFVVPLSDQALQVLIQLSAMQHGRALGPWAGRGRLRVRIKGLKPFHGFVFTINGKNPISDATINKALRTMGYDKDTHVGHGFRKSFSTLMHEAGEESAVIELSLAHVDKNKVRGIYNKAERLKDRSELMQTWGNYCEG